MQINERKIDSSVMKFLRENKRGEKLIFRLFKFYREDKTTNGVGHIKITSITKIIGRVLESVF
jgi:hypothetical protein